MTTEKLKSIYPAYSEFNWWVRLVFESGREILFTDMDYISCMTLLRDPYIREEEIKIIDYGQNDEAITLELKTQGFSCSREYK